MRETEDESNEKDAAGERDSRHCCLLARLKRAREKMEERRRKRL